MKFTLVTIIALATSISVSAEPVYDSEAPSTSIDTDCLEETKTSTWETTEPSSEDITSTITTTTSITSTTESSSEDITSTTSTWEKTEPCDDDETSITTTTSTWEKTEPCEDDETSTITTTTSTWEKTEPCEDETTFTPTPGYTNSTIPVVPETTPIPPKYGNVTTVPDVTPEVPGTTVPVVPGTTAPVVPGTTAPVVPGTTAPVVPPSYGTTPEVVPALPTSPYPAEGTISTYLGAAAKIGETHVAVVVAAAAYLLM